MKKLFRKLGLTLATVVCFACTAFGTAIMLPEKNVEVANAETVLPTTENFYVSGAGIRLINDANGTGLRFHTRLSLDAYATITSGEYTTGTLIIPEMRYDGELTLEDLDKTDTKTRPVHIDTTDIWWDNANAPTEKQSTVYLYNIPESAYGARYVARSYVEYNGTTYYTEESVEKNTSIADVANAVSANASTSETTRAQVTPYAVDEVTVTYAMPDGNKQTETVGYGEKLSGPTYDTDGYVLSGLTDQYGNAVNLATYEATLPVTITVSLDVAQGDKVVAAQLIKDGYGATSENRAFVNASTATAVTEGIPEGYDTTLRLDWYQNSTELWKVGGNPLYRSLYNQTDISGYARITFAFKLETDGDACVQIYPMHSSRNHAGVIKNEWLGVELVQTSTNVWSMTVTRLSDGEVVCTYEGMTRNNNGLTDVDSIASLVFPACKWDGATPTILINPCTSADMTASIYMTEVLGYNDLLIPPSDAIEVDSTAFCDWTWGVNNNRITALETLENEVAPIGFTTVSKISSGSAWTSSSQSSGFCSDLDITNYSEVWFAYKAVNSHFTQTKPTWTDIDTNTQSVWIYFHLTQTGETTDSGYLLWDIEIIKDGVLWGTIEDQHCNGTTNTVQKLFDYDVDDNGRIVEYHSGSGTAEFYATEIRGILKDGVEAPEEEEEFSFQLPANAVPVRSSIWRANNYALSSSTSEPAPDGFKNVEEFNWADNPANWAETTTNMQTTCFDEAVVTGFSDIYYAIKFVGGNGIFVRNGSNYTGGNWLYVHFAKANDGTWSLSLKSPDGYKAENVQTGLVGDNLLTLMSYSTTNGAKGSGLYPTKNADETNAILYMTEMYGVPEETWETRIIWSAVDGAAKTEDAIGVPYGFTSIYKKTGFAISEFAALDISIYDEVRFGMLADVDFAFKSGYGYTVDGETEARPTTTIMTKTTSANQMYLVTLTKNDDGSWHITINCKRWAAASTTIANSTSVQTEIPFEADVTGNSLSEIMSTILTQWSTMTLYVTEVRGVHTCATELEYESLGNGYMQGYCPVCGEAIGEPVPFEHGIPADAEQILDQVWRSDDYALSASTDEAIPYGFNNIIEFIWHDNAVNWQESNVDMGLTCIPTDDLSAYSDVYFAMKLVGGAGIFVRGGSKYTGGDWLYAHYTKADDGTWSLLLKSPDGYTAEKTGIEGNDLKTMMSYSGNTNGFYPTRTATYWKHKTDGTIVYEDPNDKTNYTAYSEEEAVVYLTDLVGIVACEHTEGTKFECNDDGTHNVVCTSCEAVIETVACSGGIPTCTAKATCSTCGGTYGDLAAHEATWVLGKYTCSVCGEVLDTATVIDTHGFHTDTGTRLVDNADLGGVTAPEGFSTVTRKDSSTGWTSSALAAEAFNRKSLALYKEVWVAYKVVNGDMRVTNHNVTITDGSWMTYHLTRTDDSVWTIEVIVNGVVKATLTEQSGENLTSVKPYNSIARMFYDEGYSSTDGNAILIYHSGSGTASVYSTEIIGVLDPTFPSTATKVWDSVWRSDLTGELTNVTGETAPAGYSNIVEYTWAADSTYFTINRMNNSTDITVYSDIYFAIKLTGGSHIYCRACTDHYTTGGWLYVHYEQTGEGVWTMHLTSPDGYERISTQTYEGTTLHALMNGNLYPHKVAGENPAYVYVTELLAVEKCDGTNHTEDSIESNGDGTHSVYCRCGTAISESAACSGGTATCTALAVCSTCGGTYGDLLAHVAAKTVSNGDDTHSSFCSCGALIETVACSGGTATCTAKATCSTCKTEYGTMLAHVGAWDGDVYVCESCGNDLGNVEAELDHQTTAFFTDATSITANEESALTLDLSSATALTISSATVDINGATYTAAVANNVLTINAVPKYLFGEYVATVTATVEDKAFTISAPVLVVTNMITKNETMLAMKYVLRGKTSVEKVTGDGVYQGGAGGVATMNGDGYYMLGGNIALTQDGGGVTDVYVWGTSTVPFVGTFDGNGHILSGYMKTNWFSGHTLEDGSITSSYANELEASLFGYVNGTVKNVALTGIQLGVYANIVLDGTGTFEDVYVEITNLQQNANLYVAPFFWRNSASTHGTLRNVVFNLKNHSSTYVTDSGTHTSSTHYPAATGKYFAAENVAVYGFNKNWINSDGTRGNVYFTDVTTDGSDANIYVEYADATTNGITFLTWNLDNALWKIVDGVPVLMNVNTTTGNNPESSFTAPTQNKTDTNLVTSGATDYYVDWASQEAGSYAAVQLIKEVLNKATGATLGVGLANLEDLNTKQIVVGTYGDYQGYVDLNSTIVLTGDTYGVYTNGNTYFVLAEDEDGFEYAAKAFCREFFGYAELAPDGEYSYVSATTVAKQELNYTTEIGFSHRQAAYSSVDEEKDQMGFTRYGSYTTYVAMHNALDYINGYTDTDGNTQNAYTGDDKANMLSDDGAADPDDTTAQEQLCYLAHGNATSFANMVNHVKNVIVAQKAANPNMTAINFMIEDDPEACGCDYCSQFSNPSITQLIFLNALSEALQDAGCDVDVVFFAYSSFCYAPVLEDADITALASIQTTLGLEDTVVATDTFKYSDLNKANATYTAATDTTAYTVLKAADNLRLDWTSHKANHSYALSHAANDHMYMALLAWIASVGAENIDVFMYQVAYRDYFMPLNTWEYQVLWYQELNALGVGSRIFNLGNVHNPLGTQTSFAAFKTYIDSRVMTDRYVTFDQLKEEFFSTSGYYGAGGPTMLKYFNELVEVLENKKQKETGVAIDDYIDPAADIAEQAWDDVTDATRAQSFFNGAYGYNMDAVLFPDATGTTYTPSQDLYVHSNYTSQLLTLEAWYGYCQTALAAVSGDATYEKRINVEAIFPEYAILMSNSEYASALKKSLTNDTWSGSVTPTLKSTSITTSYETFYNKIVSLGVLTFSEFYTFDSTEVHSMAKSGIRWYGLYASFFKNWGVV